MFGHPQHRRLRPLAVALGAGISLAAFSAPPAFAANQPPEGAVPVGDFNGDGFLDFAADEGSAIVSAPTITFGSAGPGVVRLLKDGGTGVRIWPDATPDWLNPYPGFKQLALPVRVGDVDADGFDDVIQPGAMGKSWLVYGRPGTATIDIGTPEQPGVTTLLHEYSNPRHQLNVGIGDFNGDGYDDWMQSRTTRQERSVSALAKTGGGVVVLGGPRVVELETRGQGPRRVQIDTKHRQQCGVFAIWFPVPACNYWWSTPGLEPAGDIDRDGKMDLFQPEGSFVIRGRASTATFHAHRLDGVNTIKVATKPTTSPWSADPVPPPPPPVDPTAQGMAGWTVFGAARWIDRGASINLASPESGGSGAIFDSAKLVDANEIVVDFDIEFVSGTAAPGNGMTLAFASKSEGGLAANYNYGIGLGWVGNKGIAIALGNVKGTFTPSNNYVGIVNSVVGRSGYPTFLQSAPAGSPLTNAKNSVRFTATGGVVTVAINGVERLRRTMQMPTDAYLGFTGATHHNSQDHIVSNVKVSKPTS